MEPEPLPGAPGGPGPVETEGLLEGSAPPSVTRGEDRGGDGGASECTETATSIGTSNRITLKVMVAFGILLSEE